MPALDYPDSNAAIASFIKHFRGLSRLPLISDPEMGRLFGEEVADALAGLDRYNRQEGICEGCVYRCCQSIRCELYVPALRLCLIHDFRPTLCRMHFCNRFGEARRSLIKCLGDIFLNSLLAAEPLSRNKVLLFDSPPLTDRAPALVAAITPWVNAVKEGNLAEASARRFIGSAVRRYHTSVCESK